MVEISSPNPTDTRSALADWLELQTLLGARGVSIRASLLQVLDILEDDAARSDPVDAETGEVLDEAILEGERQLFVDVTCEELHYRRQTLGESYPFEVDAARYRLARRADQAPTHTGPVGSMVFL